jgi:tetratricopeptide (TPR) repeat protein
MVWALYELPVSKGLDIRWKGVVVGGTLLTLSLLTWRQLDYWRSDYDLWSHTLQVTKGNFEAEEKLALTLMDLHREDQAVSHFQNVTKAVPDDPIALLNIGNYLEKHGSHEQAIAEFAGIVRDPKDPVQLTAAYTGLGVAYAQLGELAKARENLLNALWINPRDQSASYDLSMVEAEDGIEKMSVLVTSHPTAQRYLSLGQLLQQDQRSQEAEVAYQKALRLDPHLAEAAQALLHLKESSR